MRRLALLLVLGWCAGAEAQDSWVIRVLDPEGRPVPRARLWLREKGAHHLNEQWRYVENGRFEHRTHDGEARLRVEVMQATDAEGRPLPLGAAVAGPSGPGEIVIRLAAQKEIRGTVRTTDGKPVPGARVNAIRDDAGAPGYHDEAVSDASGAFRLTRLGAFRYRLETEPPPGFLRLEPVRVDGGATDAVVLLRAMVTPRLVVRGPDGRLLPGCRVRMERPVEDDVVRTTDATGAVVLPHVDPTRSHPLHVVPGTTGILPRFDGNWLPRNTTVVLERASAIAGVVRRVDGTPVPDASVWVRVAPGAKTALPSGWSWFRLADGSLQGSLSDAAGRFEMGRLPRVDLIVFATIVLDDGTVVRSVPVRVSPDARDIRLSIP
jgi:hypothetical protein